MNFDEEQMNIVIVGHVDHGKSTVIGRLLADTGSLPKGKLEQVKHNCELNAKPFEYAFLLDALKDEQSQGITIDTARCFFKTAKRHYIIIDAPGHIEFLKNMITGAARAEAALLVIDAKEGVQENSRRHGFMLSLLGISQIVVLVNKMDRVGYNQENFEQVKGEYLEFLKRIKVQPLAFIPISAREGDNLVALSSRMPWYHGFPVIEMMDSLQKEKQKEHQPFRFPLQSIYKFTEDGDERRIFAGTVETGNISVGEEVIFLPSRKKSQIESIEGFNEPGKSLIQSGYATGFTLKTQIYVKPGEMMCRLAEKLPNVGTAFRANIFWMGKQPMLPGKNYKMKIATNRATVFLRKIEKVLDASDLSNSKKKEIDRYDVAECILQTLKPIAYDIFQEIETTGRFVIIDNYEIVGGGIITESILDKDLVTEDDVTGSEQRWEKSNISPLTRAERFHQKPALILFAGEWDSFQQQLAKVLEEKLFREGRGVYYLGLSNSASGSDTSLSSNSEERDEMIHRLGKLAHFFADAGMIFITSVPGFDESEFEILNWNEYDLLWIHIDQDSFGDSNEALYFTHQDDVGNIIEMINRTLLKKGILEE
ncbi:MAG TPA: adenylyl-sulfate kinase [Firmicutes bacterium]|jgi:bifunctional enzyme CysN/CysC|nr:adenylyl-sulfate kinase [Bacillota bacterium]